MGELTVVIVTFALSYLSVLAYMAWMWRRSREDRGARDTR